MGGSEKERVTALDDQGLGKSGIQGTNSREMEIFFERRQNATCCKVFIRQETKLGWWGVGIKGSGGKGVSGRISSRGAPR